MEKTLWKSRAWLICGLMFTLCALTLVSVCEAKSSYTAGLVGIKSTVPGAKDNNIAAYFNMQNKDDPMEFAQNYFSEIFNTELADIKTLTTLDMTERTTLPEGTRLSFNSTWETLLKP